MKLGLRVIPIGRKPLARLVPLRPPGRVMPAVARLMLGLERWTAVPAFGVAPKLGRRDPTEGVRVTLGLRRPLGDGVSRAPLSADPGRRLPGILGRRSSVDGDRVPERFGRVMPADGVRVIEDGVRGEADGVRWMDGTELRGIEADP